jgi:glycosyltransferase 2 family protein
MKLTHRAWWPWVKRALLAAFFIAVAYLLVRYARGVDWGEVKQSVLELPRHVLATALLLAAGAHLAYSTLDLIGRYYTRHPLSKLKTLQVSSISYAFNLNLGSLVGGVGFRYRLYSRLGLPTGQITQILTLSMMTNWLGYILLAGLVFTISPLQLPPHWKLDSEELRLLGVALLAVAVSYLLACAFSRRRNWRIRGYDVELPSLRMAIGQLAIASAQWTLTASVAWVLLQGRVDYPTVLSVLLVAGIAGVITHIPAGLGVIEAVFIALLSHRVPEHQLLGALLAYRAVYYLVPLAVAALQYLKVEVRTRKPAPAA